MNTESLTSLVPAFIAASSLFTPKSTFYGKGVIAHDNEKDAITDTWRREHLFTKNQWFTILIPSQDKFIQDIQTDTMTMNQQSSYIKEHLFSDDALTVLFKKECIQYFPQLDAVIRGNDQENNPEFAKEKVQAFYDEKRESVLSLTIKDYLKVIREHTYSMSNDMVTAYLVHFGIAGVEYRDGQYEGNSFLIYNARKDVVIKSTFREMIAESRLVS